jgi:hypothetical protein
MIESFYDPVPDAIAFLARKSASERHAMSRLLDVDGRALSVLAWIVDQPDCDLATAAMAYWRLRTLTCRREGLSLDLAARISVLEAIHSKVRAGHFGTAKIAWDGYEAWDRIALIGASPLNDLPKHDDEVTSALSGPFGTTLPNPAAHAFLDDDYGDDDIFDSLWRVSPDYAAAVDWLIGKSADAWMIAVDQMLGHCQHVYEWMLRQPECPAPVAGQIFWRSNPEYWAGLDSNRQPNEILTLVLQRWRAGTFAPSDLDFSRYANTQNYREVVARLPLGRDPLDVPNDLLAPVTGRQPPPIDLNADFEWWRFNVSISGLVPRPRTAAIAAWEKSREAKREHSTASQQRERQASMLDRLFYGGAFTGAPAQIDRCWKQFNIVTIAGALLLVVLIRGGMPKAAFYTFFALVVVIAFYQSSAKMGSSGRILAWWLVATLVTMALAMLFRWMDTGHI